MQYRSGAAQDADSVAQRLVGDCGRLEENDGCSSESLVSLAARRNNARAPGKCSTWNIFAPEVPGPASFGKTNNVPRGTFSRIPGRTPPSYPSILGTGRLSAAASRASSITIKLRRFPGRTAAITPKLSQRDDKMFHVEQFVKLPLIPNNNVVHINNQSTLPTIPHTD